MSPSRKICTLEGLLEQREAARRAGRTVVQCHGCFDIVHPGHIHYLQFARRQGDVLIVSISADPQVNKGADRPLIPEEHRAAALAALECVDYVYVNPHPTAVELLDQVRPDVYVKGREYETNNDPRFIAEREAVARHGGRVVFSSGDVIYSSTQLIGGIGGLDAFNDEKVKRYRGQYELRGPELMRLIESFRGRRVVVIGDYILDRYHFCEATSVAAEAPMMNLRQLRSEEYDGGAAVVALHLAGLGASAHLVTSLNDKGIEGRLRRRGIMLDAIESRRDIAIKQRFLVDLTKVLKIDQGASNAIDTSTEAAVADKIITAASGAAAAIFVDFGYGLITSSLLERVLPELRRRVDIITADVSGIRSNLLCFNGVDLLCPTEREARETLHDFSSSINTVVWQLLSKTSAKQALITLGKQGLLVFDQHRQRDANESWERRLRSEYLPALANHAIDPLGCGDALLATASLALAAGGSIHAAAYLGSLAAACQARRIGNAPVTLDEIFGLLGQVPAHTEPAQWRLAS